MGIPDLWGGAVLTLVTLVAWEFALVVLSKIASLYMPAAFLFSLFVLYSCIALQDLAHHVQPIVIALERNDMEKSRQHLQMIVGRDTTVLDKQGIIRATIETISEGLVDGFLSPIFWFSVFSVMGAYTTGNPCLFGIAGTLGYRIVNTLDSMIGYKNETYLHFGRFAAKLDDFANFIPSRLSILFLFLGAWLSKRDAAAGFKSAAKYRLHADSPNAGHPESFVAGVFHIQLGGLTRYPFGEVKKPFMGNGTSQPTTETVRQVLRFITFSGYVAAGIFCIFLWALPFSNR